MANWEKILNQSVSDLSALLVKHSGEIEKTYDDAEEGQGVDINLKLVFRPGKENAVTIKSAVSFTAERIKDSNKCTVTDQGELFVQPEDGDGADGGDTEPDGENPDSDPPPDSPAPPEATGKGQ